MRPLQTRLALLAALVLAGACSLLVRFDPEGQPCEGTKCLLGYACVLGKCVSDAGPPDECGGCGLTERCSPTMKSCVPNTCQFRRCPVGTRCSEASGLPACQAISKPELAHSCRDEADCETGRNCYLGAVQLNSNGALRTGICVERCGFLDACPSGATCQTFAIGLDAGEVRFCAPTGALYRCTNDNDCREHDLVCTVFDHPAIGPSTLCDSPTAGASPGQTCTLLAGDGGSLCANGLCIPRQPSGVQATTCGELCDVRADASTCALGRPCALVEFHVVGDFRHLPMCVSAPTACAKCQSDADCGPDAPRCTSNGIETRCLAACSPSAGAFPRCPSGYGCVMVPSGATRCIPVSGC
ncbi:MAG: hypothetical protein HYZ28_02045 [Myxococcales bacterium]|nr:hypothetical protein [Myxococcales bacterium]